MIPLGNCDRQTMVFCRELRVGRRSKELHMLKLDLEQSTESCYIDTKYNTENLFCFDT
jgi:hypothetical protein